MFITENYEILVKHCVDVEVITLITIFFKVFQQ